MKKNIYHQIVICFLFLQSFINAQVSRDSAISIRINKEDVSTRIDWIISDQDSLAFAKPDYNDNNWKKFQFSFLKNSSEKVYWLRSYIKVDSHLINQPLQIAVMQLGASEIYLDGRRIATIGEISNNKVKKFAIKKKEPILVSFNVSKFFLGHQRSWLERHFCRPFPNAFLTLTSILKT